MNKFLKSIIDKMGEIEDDEEKMDGWDAWIEIKEFIDELSKQANQSNKISH